MGGHRPEGHYTDHRNERMDETSSSREEWRRLLREARVQKGLDWTGHGNTWVNRYLPWTPRIMSITQGADNVHERNRSTNLSVVIFPTFFIPLFLSLYCAASSTMVVKIYRVKLTAHITLLGKTDPQTLFIWQKYHLRYSGLDGGGGGSIIYLK
jgi:hypothetical protein